MTSATEPAGPNSNRSHAVQELIERWVPDIDDSTWMSDELLQHLHGAFEATRTLAIMQRVRMGLVTPEQAQELQPAELFIAAFNLGFKVGQELEKDNAFRTMMGEETY